jgi:methionine-rich copper-binding protein CopC
MIRYALMIFAICSVIVAAPSFSHAKLQNSSPAANAQLTEAPKVLTLKFSEAAHLAVLKLVTDGKEIPVPIDPKAAASDTFSLTLPALAPGKYTVQWSAVAADDGHITKGSFAFSIGG